MKASVNFITGEHKILTNVRASHKNGVTKYTHSSGVFTDKEIKSISYLMA